jgi:malectin (di-glucose binding ER protein)
MWAHMQKPFYFILCVGLVAFLAGCQTENKQASSTQKTATTTPASAATPSAPAQPAAKPAAPAQPAAAAATAPVTATTIRVKAGAETPFKDSSGNVWQADQGFDGGDVVGRPELAIANTKDQGLYQSEHYSMNSFSCKLPNGKYTAKLHFAETFENITGPGQRVFSFNVQGHDFKDFDVFVKAGGAARAYIETVPVEVTNGTFKIVFTPNMENPQINAIEIVPAS